MGNQFNKNEPKPENITDEHIKKFISKIMSDKKANLSFLPDSVEAKIYEKLITILLANLKESLETVKIELLGHVITIKINPIT